MGYDYQIREVDNLHKGEIMRFSWTGVFTAKQLGDFEKYFYIQF